MTTQIERPHSSKPSQENNLLDYIDNIPDDASSINILPSYSEKTTQDIGAGAFNAARIFTPRDGGDVRTDSSHESGAVYTHFPKLP